METVASLTREAIGGSLSPTAIHEALGDDLVGLVGRALERGSRELAWSLVESVFERHYSDGGVAELLEKLGLGMGHESLEIAVRLGGHASEAPAHPNPAPLPIAVVGMARVVRGWL